MGETFDPDPLRGSVVMKKIKINSSQQPEPEPVPEPVYKPKAESLEENEQNLVAFDDNLGVVTTKAKKEKRWFLISDVDELDKKKLGWEKDE